MRRFCGEKKAAAPDHAHHEYLERIERYKQYTSRTYSTGISRKGREADRGDVGVAESNGVLQTFKEAEDQSRVRPRGALS